YVEQCFSVFHFAQLGHVILASFFCFPEGRLGVRKLLACLLKLALKEQSTSSRLSRKDGGGQFFQFIDIRIRKVYSSLWIAFLHRNIKCPLPPNADLRLALQSGTDLWTRLLKSGY